MVALLKVVGRVSQSAKARRAANGHCPISARLADLFGQSKVEQHGGFVTGANFDVVGFNVAVNGAHAVQRPYSR